MAKKKKELPLGMAYFKEGLIRYRFSINKKKYSVYGRTVKECSEKERQLQKEIEEGTYKKGTDQTFSNYSEKWLENREQEVTSATIVTYTKIIKRICLQKIDDAGTVFGDLPLKDIEIQHVRSLQKGLQQDTFIEVKGKKKKLPKMQTRSVNDAVHLLKGILKTAQVERILQWNPCEGVKPLKRTEAHARDTIHRALTKAEVDAFMEEAAKRNSHYQNLYTVLLYTGLRIGEASALTVWDTTNDKITVNKTVTRSEWGYEIEGQTKTEAGKRTIPMREEVKKAIEAQKALNIDLYGKLDTSKPLFRMPKGGIIRGDRVNEEIRRICKTIGIDYFSCHAFRATFITRCVNAGMPVKDLMVIAGHSDVQMTLGLYAHEDAKQSKDSLKAVNF